MNEDPLFILQKDDSNLCGFAPRDTRILGPFTPGISVRCQREASRHPVGGGKVNKTNATSPANQRTLRWEGTARTAINSSRAFARL